MYTDNTRYIIMPQHKKKQNTNIAKVDLSDIYDEIEEENKVIEANPKVEKPDVKESIPMNNTFQKVIIDNAVYYRDAYCAVLNADLKFVGMYTRKGNVYEYILNDES